MPRMAAVALAAALDLALAQPARARERTRFFCIATGPLRLWLLALRG